MTASTGQEVQELAAPKPAIPRDSFAIRLMLVRVHAGDITVRDAADRTGLNYGSWSNWERGMQPRDKADVVAAISETFGIDREWLMYGGPLEPELRRRRGIGGVLAERPKGMHFRAADVTCGSVPGRGERARRPGGGRPAGRPDEFTRPARLTRPISR